MTYKAIVLDLDGTLMTSKNQIPDKTKNMLIKIQEKGIKVILASGRPMHGLLKASKILQLKKYGGYLLAYNGGQIIDMKDDSLIFDSYLDMNTILELYDKSRLLNTSLLAYNDQSILTEDNDQYIQIESEINDLVINQVDNFKDALKTTSVKCLMTGEPTHLANVEIQLKAMYQNQLSISRSMPFFIECMPKGINKGNCLSILLKKLNIDKNEVIACGDGYNDISLIEAVGLGVAMGNGCKPVKDKAKYITSSNDEDGIVQVIEKFILNNKKDLRIS
ncbi:HAD family phosphatase [Mycoplasmatota bacterium]|nr:HAD family phosphatase [Mycoplasmatota bacterium]